MARKHLPRGCAFTFRDGQYHQQCPAALAHNRAGMSIGYIVREDECSICHQDPQECDHITGRVYDGQRCVRIIKRADLLEYSVVGRPAQPDARITSVSLSLSELQAKLGTKFIPGVEITCDRCLSPCDGVARPFESGVWTNRRPSR